MPGRVEGGLPDAAGEHSDRFVEADTADQAVAVVDTVWEAGSCTHAAQSQCMMVVVHTEAAVAAAAADAREVVVQKDSREVHRKEPAQEGNRFAVVAGSTPPGKTGDYMVVVVVVVAAEEHRGGNRLEAEAAAHMVGLDWEEGSYTNMP
jgi:hypothetical protein